MLKDIVCYFHIYGERNNSTCGLWGVLVRDLTWTNKTSMFSLLSHYFVDFDEWLGDFFCWKFSFSVSIIWYEGYLTSKQHPLEPGEIFLSSNVWRSNLLQVKIELRLTSYWHRLPSVYWRTPDFFYLNSPVVIITIWIINTDYFLV